MPTNDAYEKALRYVDKNWPNLAGAIEEMVGWVNDDFAGRGRVNDDLLDVHRSNEEHKQQTQALILVWIALGRDKCKSTHPQLHQAITDLKMGKGAKTSPKYNAGYIRARLRDYNRKLSRKHAPPVFPKPPSTPRYNLKHHMPLKEYYLRLLKGLKTPHGEIRDKLIDLWDTSGRKIVKISDKRNRVLVLRGGNDLDDDSYAAFKSRKPQCFSDIYVSDPQSSGKQMHYLLLLISEYVEGMHLKQLTSAISEACHLANMTRNKLNKIKSSLDTDSPRDRQQVEAMQKHFGLDIRCERRDDRYDNKGIKELMGDLYSRYLGIYLTLLDGISQKKGQVPKSQDVRRLNFSFVFHPKSEALGETKHSSTAYHNIELFLPAFFNLRPYEQAATIIHELSHSMYDTKDHAYLSDGRLYKELPAYASGGPMQRCKFHNADCYHGLALEINGIKPRS